MAEKRVFGGPELACASLGEPVGFEVTSEVEDCASYEVVQNGEDEGFEVVWVDDEAGYQVKVDPFLSPELLRGRKGAEEEKGIDAEGAKEIRHYSL